MNDNDGIFMGLLVDIDNVLIALQVTRCGPKFSSVIVVMYA